MIDTTFNNKPIATALLLAAGLGNRLSPLTKQIPKCLTEVNGVPILERLIVSLKQLGFKRLVIVTGHGEQHIKDFLGTEFGELKIEYIYSPLYKETNNIYSLWLAHKRINEPFLLIESDLIFDKSLLKPMLYSNRIAVAKMQSGMHGTCVSLSENNQVKEFYKKGCFSMTEQLYKTVNIYSISLNSWVKISERLAILIKNGNVNDYYEVAFSELISENIISFEAVSFDGKPWYEIDTLKDLAAAEKLFKAAKPTFENTNLTTTKKQKAS